MIKVSFELLGEPGSDTILLAAMVRMAIEKFMETTPLNLTCSYSSVEDNEGGDRAP